METKLVYLNDAYLFNSSATITEVVQTPDNKTDIQLDETIFYPQGGGQPTDKGKIKASDVEFEVDDVRFENGIVHHYGHMTKGSLKVGDKVDLSVDADRRNINMRNHTAGHLVASVIAELKPDLKANKGYHFPDGPYVQFEGIVAPEERQDLITKTQERANQMINKHREVIIKFVPYDELVKVCRFVPENIPKDKPSRIATIKDSISVPDGGTQVKNLSEIGSITITKIKGKGSETIISYKVG
jgi:Ser-tRNA(Ala) deacylase AlaX